MLELITEARVIRNQEIAADIFKIVLLAPKAAEAAWPGQFVSLYTKASQRLLPRPVSLCRISGENITLVYGVVGEGTREFSRIKAGEPIRLSMPQGNGFDLNYNKPQGRHTGRRQVTLVGGGLGVPPLLELAAALIAQGDEVQAILGFRHKPFLLSEMAELGIQSHVATDSGSQGFHGTIMDFILANPLKSDVVYACGPKGMLRSLSTHCQGITMPLQVSVEERMGCGYGACLGCVCKTRSGYKKVCTDGPVFSGEDVDWDA
jgi:dihydroorotate dehydrogenase electron transfer subunit